MNRLKQLREEKGLSLRDLSTKIGYSHSTLSLAENGKRGLSDDDIEVYSRFYNVSADYLLGLSDVRNQASTQKQLQGQQLALYNGTKDLSESQMQEILNFVEFVKSKK